MKKHVLGLLLAGWCLGASAQYVEIGLLAGGANYRGELSENSQKVFLKETGLGGGLFGRYNFSDFVALRLGVNYARLSGADANASDEVLRTRNLSFKTHLWEASLVGEFNLLGFQPYNYGRPFSPYLFAGVAAFTFNPTTSYQDQTVELQPLGTEGQGLPDRPAPYALTQVAIPFGLGFKYALNDTWTLGLELGARLAFTDYLDDVGGTYLTYDELLAGNGALAASLAHRGGELTGAEPAVQPTGALRGDDKNRDLYFLAGFTVAYAFQQNGLVGSRSRARRSKRGCRTD